MTFSLLVHTAVTATTFPVTSVECGDHLSTEQTARLRLEVTRLLPLGRGPMRAEKKRLTAVLLDRLTQNFANLGPARREHFLEVLSQATVAPIQAATLADLDEARQTDGYLKPDPERGIALYLEDYAGSSLMNWLFVDHELSHLTRWVSDGTTAAQRIDHVMRLRLRRLGYYREEINAFREEYRFLRDAYPPARLLALARLVGTLKPVNVSPLIDAGIMRILPDGSADVNQTQLERASVRLNNLLDKWVEWRCESQFLAEVRHTLAQPEAAFVRNAVDKPSYRRAQRRTERLRPLLGAMLTLSRSLPRRPAVIDRWIWQSH